MVTPVPFTWLWKPTRFSVVRQRCSHSQPDPQVTALVTPPEPDGGPASALLKVKLDITDGVPKG